MPTTAFLTAIAALLLAWPRPGGAVDLKVTGQIKPGACVVNLSQQGLVDFGAIPASTLRKDDSTLISTRQVTLNIDCAQPSNIALQLVDARATSMIPGLIGPSTSDQEAFGLGMFEQTRIGNYYLRLPRADLSIDDQPAELIYSTDGNRSWRRTGPAGELRRDRSFAWTSPRTRLPVPFKTLRAILKVTPYIAAARDLPVHQEIALDGFASLELQYF